MCTRYFFPFHSLHLHQQFNISSQSLCDLFLFPSYPQRAFSAAAVLVRVRRTPAHVAVAVSLFCLSFSSPSRAAIAAAFQLCPTNLTWTAVAAAAVADDDDDVASEVFLSGLCYKLLSNRIIGDVDRASLRKFVLRPLPALLTYYTQRISALSFSFPLIFTISWSLYCITFAVSVS